jgi:hypothetical protein
MLWAKSRIAAPLGLDRNPIRKADDRHRRRDAVERDRGAGRVGYQDVRLERDQFLRQRLELFDVAVAMVDI